MAAFLAASLFLPPAPAGLRAAAAADLNPWASVWVNEPAQPLPPGLTHHTYWSACMRHEVGYCIYLPPSYDTDKARRFPVIYDLHGNGGTEVSSSAKVAALLQASIAAGQVPPCLMVFPSGGLATMYNDSIDGTIMPETTIIKELIPYIDSHYRTIARREGRGIEGFSMGGHGSTKLAFKYPELFGSLMAWAGGMQDIAGRYAQRTTLPYVRAYLGDDQKNYQMNDPFFLLRANADRIRGRMFIQIVCGTGDDFHLKGTREMHALLDQLHIAHVYREIPDVKHMQWKLRAPFGNDGFEAHAKNFRQAGAVSDAN